MTEQLSLGITKETWQERDYHGFRQTRTCNQFGTWSNWQFYVSTFGGPVVDGRDTVANVLLTGGGTEACPLRPDSAVKIAGSWWGHEHWDH